MGLESKLGPGDIMPLLDAITRLAEQGQRTPSEAIRRIADILSPESSDERRDRAALAEFVARLRQLRMRRNELIGAPLFRDPAWDMLLELFAAHEGKRKLSVSSLCYASGVPPTTALRQLQRLEKYKLVRRSGDCRDNRRSYVEPTAKALAGIATAAALMLEQSQLVSSLTSETGRRRDPDVAAAEDRPSA